ncbi:hypothetical protein [Rhodoferax ferrireducens]|uniref:hypothetical protein n=1 Tax=Rhodoferax ferrireducens TaxID=192843 RepID=UPI000E0DBAEA|nr:hypothetical protein [Rhodoferax ferrireducens]
MNHEKKIPVTYKSSGKQRFIEPIRQQTPREANTSVDSTAPSHVTFEPQSNLQDPQTWPEAKEANKSGLSSNGESGTKTKTKSKQEITKLEHFIAYAYGRKGQPLSVKSKVLQDISPNTQIPVESLAALQKLAIADKQFCVPRQILLATREIDGYPAIKEALRSFVQTAMLWQPIFRNPKVAAAIRNLPEAPEPHAALKLVMAEVVEKEELDEKDAEERDGEKVAGKSVDPDELRVNAANCLAVWFAVTRHLSLEDVTEALNDAVWAPAGRVADPEIAKLRALTGIEKAESVGLACELYKRRAVAHAADAVRASAEVSGLRASLAEAQLQLELTNTALYEIKIALEKLQRETAEDKAALHQSTETQAAHLRDDLEQLRSRVLRRLVTDVDMLGVGLSAIQSPEPRIHVIRDRVERVIDALQTEISKLREE